MHGLYTARAALLGAAWLCAALAPSARAASVEVEAQGRDGKPLAGVVLFLESPAAKAAARPLSGVEVEQADKRFTQRVTVVPVGTAVSFPNRDKVRHHVYSFSPAKTFELKLYVGNPANPVVFDKPGIATLGCNIHDQMVAWVVAVETPYLGLSGANGRLRLPDVPAGSYRLRSWHPDLPVGTPALDQSLVVGAGHTSATVRLPL